MPAESSLDSAWCPGKGDAAMAPDSWFSRADWAGIRLGADSGAEETAPCAVAVAEAEAAAVAVAVAESTAVAETTAVGPVQAASTATAGVGAAAVAADRG